MRGKWWFWLVPIGPLVVCVCLLACSSSAPIGDSDGDGISDQAEGRASEVDTDSDGSPDYLDDDSDADGISDAIEAGDEDLATPPVDSDDDGSPDFRDPDSDNDGLSDRDEVVSGTSRVSADTDADGASDLAETVLGTDPLDASDNPEQRGEAVLIVGWGRTAVPERSTVSFQTHIQLFDVYLLFDKSGSMQAEIDAIRDSVEATLGALTCSEIEDPTMRTCVPSIFSGAGQYHDPYNNVLSIQADHAITRETIDNITAEASISREDFFESVNCVADGTCGTGCTPPVGCPGYRPDAIKLLVAFTDEDSDMGTLTAAASALLTSGIEPLGVWAAADDLGRNDMEDLALATDSFRADGTTPRVLDGMDASASAAFDLGIREVLEALPLRVTIEATDRPGDDGDALSFIDYLTVNTTGDGACSSVPITEDTDADGRPDAFPVLRTGTSVCWDVVPVMNDFTEPSNEPLVFRARLAIRGDGSPLDQRDVVFIVPPEFEP